MWSSTLITLFPELYPGPLGVSCLGQGLKHKIWSLNVLNLRDFGQGPHRRVDAPPTGGGAGMVLRSDVLGHALDAALALYPGVMPRLVMFSPRGQTFSQTMAQNWARDPRPLVGLCGRFEGVDERIFHAYPLEEVSIGDYILAGGDSAACVVLESVVRLLPGIMGNDASAGEESFTQGGLEYPHYTYPKVWKNHTVPEVLYSGHHKNIAQWRRNQASILTQNRRPDLWADEKKHDIMKEK